MKKMMIVMMLALFSIAGMSQDKYVFKSQNQTMFVDGVETEHQEDVTITTLKTVLYIESDGGTMTLLFTGEAEKIEDEEKVVTYFELIDANGIHAMLGLAYFKESDAFMYRLVAEHYEVYYNGEFIETPKKKEVKKWDGLKSI